MQDENSLRGRVFHTIKQGILDGKYPNGSLLREISLGEELGVSRTPVREALRQLELEELVEIIPNKGARVSSITQKDILDIYLIRARLEGLCAGMAVESITSDQLDRLDEIILLSKFYEKKNDFEHLVKMDSEFHEVLYEACGSKMLLHLLRDYHQYVQSVRRRSLEQYERAGRSTEEHAAILEAVKERNKEVADKLMTAHIMNTLDNIVRGDLL